MKKNKNILVKKGKRYVTLLLLCVLSQGELYPSQNDTTFYKNDPDNLLSNLRKTILTIPIHIVQERFINNTQQSPSTPPSDSFFIEAANGLINYECSKYFKISSYLEGYIEIYDSLSFFYDFPYSKLTGNDTNFAITSALMKRTAEKFDVDLILLPLSCDIEHITFQEKGWRASPSYQRPIKYISKTKIHLQLWDKDGNLIYERIGKNKTDRPVLYSLFKKENPKEGEEIGVYAKRFFAPPAIRSLSKSIVAAMKIHKDD